MQEPVAQRRKQAKLRGPSAQRAAACRTLYAACPVLSTYCVLFCHWVGPLQLEKLREQLNELHRQVDGASTSMTEDAIQRWVTHIQQQRMPPPARRK